jgi:hypothetical protein
MTRRLKILGLTLLAALAVGAVAALTASASFPLFHVEAEDTVLTGSQGQLANANVLTTDFGELKCKDVKYAGTQEGLTASTLTLKPKFEQCQHNGENAVVTENTCAFLFHLGESTEPVEAQMDIECVDGDQLVVHTEECTTTIPPQSGLKKVTFTNEGEATTRSIIADLNVGEIHYVEHGEGCATETETTENGTFTGRTTVTGEDSEQNHIGIWVE